MIRSARLEDREVVAVVVQAAYAIYVERTGSRWGRYPITNHGAFQVKVSD